MSTINSLIGKLEKIKETHGGEVEVALKDSDTAWHMKIGLISESSTTKGRILIRSQGYDAEDLLEKH